MSSRAPIERATATDLMELAYDVSDAPTVVAAVMLLGPGSALDLAAVRGALGARILALPRLRQRLVRAPFGCGRRYWVDDLRFDIGHHVRAVHCPAPGDEGALLGVAAETVTQPLAADRPLWAVTLVTGLADGGAALVVVLHHVLADGMGGLAILARLVDGDPGASPTAFPRPAPGRRDLFADALRTRLRALTRLPAGARLLRAAVAELTQAGTARVPPSSLNRPTGPRRSLGVARVDLAAVHDVGHAHGATVNAVVLSAVTGALHTVLCLRGETVERFVISVPISARREASATQLGNDVGVLLVAVPATGDPLRRMAAITRSTHERRLAAADSSTALLAPVFRTLAGLGLLRWFVNRQRFVTTVVTNLRGPDTHLSFLGAPITGVIPMSSGTGNVTVWFVVLSYAGTLVVTVVADPQRCPDLAELVTQLQRELDALALG